MDGDNGNQFDPELHLQEPSLNTLANDMFQKSADYLQGELLLMMVSVQIKLKVC